MKDRKDNLLNDEELDDVAGVRASNESWTCPRCGQMIFCAKYSFDSKIKEHQKWHADIDKSRNPNSENEDDENWRLIMPDPVNGKE